MTADVPTEHQDFYKRLRDKVETWSSKKLGDKAKYSEWVLLAPDMFHLLARLVMDPEVPVKNKAILGAALAYFVSPIDLVPETLLGPVGLVDDVGFAAFAIHRLINDGGSARVRHHWAGKGDVLEVVQDVVRRADEMLGSGLAGRIRSLVQRPEKVSEVTAGTSKDEKTGSKERDMPDDLEPDADERPEVPT